jgi:uncharacterized membrane protein
MTKIEDSIKISAAPNKIVEYLWNVNNLPNHLPISDIKVLDESEKAIKFHHKITAGGKTMDVVCSMMQPEKNKKITFNVIEGGKVDGTWLLEPEKKDTKLTIIVDYKPPGGIFGPIIDKLGMKKEMSRIYTESLQKLKHIMEKQD